MTRWTTTELATLVRESPKAERVEFEQLRRENKRIREENEILKKFWAFCAKLKR